MIHREQVTISMLDTDEKVLVRPLSYYGWMLDSAARHCIPLKLTGPDMNAEGLTWVITHFSVIWNRFLDWTHSVTVETWPQECKGFKTRRDYRILTQKGETVSAGASNWCLLDIKTRKPVPMERIADRLVSCHKEEALPEWKGERISAPAVETLIRDCPEHKVAYGDLDFNDHCTNMRYVEWAWNALDTAFQKEHRPERLDVQFLNEAFSGDILVVNSEITGSISLQSLTDSEGSVEYCRIKTSWRKRKDGE